MALLVDEHSVRSLHYDDPDTIVDRRAADISYLLGNASDVELLEGCSLEEVRARLDRAVDREEARDLLVILLDGENPEEMDEASAAELQEIRREAAEELDELLGQPEILDSVERIFYSVPVPADGDFDGALACCKGDSVCHKFLQDLQGSQAAIRNVKAAWDRASREVFETIAERDLAESLCVREGLFRNLLKAGDSETELMAINSIAIGNSELLKFIPKHTVQCLIAQWIGMVFSETMFVMRDGDLWRTLAEISVTKARSFVKSDRRPALKGVQSNLVSETVQQLALRNPVTVHPDTPVREVVEHMKLQRLGCAVVVDVNHKPLGMFTESMLIERLASGERELNKSVSEWMAVGWPSVNQNDPILYVLVAMRTQNVSFIWVVDDDGMLVGLTGQRGLMEYIADHFPEQVMVRRTGSIWNLKSREGA